MSMLFLFDYEIERYNFLDKETNDKIDTRIPVEKTDKIYHIEYRKKDLELDAECLRLSQNEFIQKHINYKNLRYIGKEIARQELEEYIRFKFELYNVQQDYIDMLDELEVFDKRISKGYEYIIKKFSKIDTRNLYVHGMDKCLYLGERLKNEDDPRILGALASGKMIMDAQEYLNFIQSIKDEIQSS